MYRQHLYVCLVLVLLAGPLYLIDQYLLKSKGGWISLDFRGALISTYGFIIGAHLVFSTVFLVLLKDASLVYVHLASGVLSCVVVFGGYFIYDRRRRHIDHAAYVERQQQRRKLMEVIQLRRWWYIPDASTAEQIYVMVKVNEGGRFSGNAQGREEGTFGNQVFASADVVQRQVTPGEEFTFLFPLTRYREGGADEVSIALYLFKDNAGTAAEDVSIIFTTHPELEDDGHFLYATLPDPD